MKTIYFDTLKGQVMILTLYTESFFRIGFTREAGCVGSIGSGICEGTLLNKLSGTCNQVYIITLIKYIRKTLNLQHLHIVIAFEL